MNKIFIVFFLVIAAIVPVFASLQAEVSLEVDDFFDWELWSNEERFYVEFTRRLPFEFPSNYTTRTGKTVLTSEIVCASKNGPLLFTKEGEQFEIDEITLTVTLAKKENNAVKYEIVTTIPYRQTNFEKNTSLSGSITTTLSGQVAMEIDFSKEAVFASSDDGALAQFKFEKVKK